MSFRAAIFSVSCLAATTTGAAAQASGTGQLSWARSVQSRLLAALTGLHAPLGSTTLLFTVTADGRLVGVAGQGDPQVSAAATAAMRRLGHVDAPPDRRPHAMSVRFNNR